MKQLIAAITTILLTTNIATAKTTTMYCDGADTRGNHVFLIAQSDSNIVNINGDYLRIIGRTKDGNGIVTETFRATTGTLVYDSIVPTTQTSINIFQFDAVYNNLLAQASLGCTFSGYTEKNPSIMGQKIFGSLIK